MSEDTHAPGDFGWAVATILREYQLRFEEAVDCLGIRPFQVLSTVAHRDPANQQALGFHLGIDRTVLTYLLDRLVADGLVERVPIPTDRRARRIILTDAGRDALTRAESRVAAFEADMLASLGADAAQAAALVQELAAAVRRPGLRACEAMEEL